MARTDRLLVITPAHNERAHLAGLVSAVSHQTRRPDRWVVVDDASTDGTADLAEELTDDLQFVDVVRRIRTPGRSYGEKSISFMHGLEVAGGYGAFTHIAVLDADITLPVDYYQRVLTSFAEDEQCGVAGGNYVTPDGVLGRTEGGFVSGPAQVFRADAFEAIGGFAALRFGGEDALAVLHLQQLGWTSQLVDGLTYEHGRRMGGGGGRGRLRAGFDFGRQDYALGNPLGFELAKLVGRITDRPYLLVALARLAGYVTAGAIDEPEVDANVRSQISQAKSARLRSRLRTLGQR